MLKLQIAFRQFVHLCVKEDFLHYVWRYKKINVLQLHTTRHEPLEIASFGMHNLNSGPDFFNAKIKIGDQLWAGNVEIHVKSSDWYVHGHEKDPAYDNVILHVVYEHDTDIFRQANSVIPTLELKPHISAELLHKYQELFSNKNKWINCENHFAGVDDFVIDSWLERLYFERLEHKSKSIEALLQDSKNDWEAVLFKLLCKYFGLKVNGDAMFSMASSFDFSVIRKSATSQERLEALFFGQAGLLDEDHPNAYFENLKKEYLFLSQKFQLSNRHVIPLKFFRLRPPNFPTIRLSQLAGLYHSRLHLFSELMDLKTLEDYYAFFDLSVSDYWKTHFTFQKESRYSDKKLTRSFIDLMLINVIIPLKFCQAKHMGKVVDTEIVHLVTQIDSEDNSIVKGFNKLKKVSHQALQSQALIELKNNYCDKQACLRCAIGSRIIY